MIVKINPNRFEIQTVADTGFDRDGKHFVGIAGSQYRGCLGRIIGWILENIFHLTVRVKGANHEIYYFNCKSFAKWYNRVSGDTRDVAKFARDRVWVQHTIDTVFNRKGDDALKLKHETEESLRELQKMAQYGLDELPANGFAPAMSRPEDGRMHELSWKGASNMFMQLRVFLDAPHFAKALDDLKLRPEIKVVIYEDGKFLDQEDPYEQAIGQELKAKGCHFFRRHPNSGRYELGINASFVSKISELSQDYSQKAQLKKLLSHLVNEIQRAIQ